MYLHKNKICCQNTIARFCWANCILQYFSCCYIIELIVKNEIWYRSWWLYFTVNLSLDMDSFNKMMAALGGNTTGPSSTVSPIPQNVSREATKLTTMTNFTNMTNGLSVASHNFNPLPVAPSQSSMSRLATCGTAAHRVEKKEVHVLKSLCIEIEF